MKVAISFLSRGAELIIKSYDDVNKLKDLGLLCEEFLTDIAKASAIDIASAKLATQIPDNLEKYDYLGLIEENFFKMRIMMTQKNIDVGVVVAIMATCEKCVGNFGKRILIGN